MESRFVMFHPSPSLCITHIFGSRHAVRLSLLREMHKRLSHYPPPPRGRCLSLLGGASQALHSEACCVQPQAFPCCPGPPPPACGQHLALAQAQPGAASSLRLVPWAGVAAHLSRNGQPAGAAGVPRLGGRAYCFLPLPATTGLPRVPSLYAHAQW